MSDGLARLLAAEPDRIEVSDIARILNVSRKAVYRWLDEGVIPGYRLDGRWLVFKDDLETALRASSNQSFGQGEPPPSA